MKTIILVGAGATLAEALPSRPPRNKMPPLDNTFFQLARVAKLPGRSSVTQYMADNYGIDPFSSDYRMEEIFNYIYSDAFSDGASEECLDAYWKLLQMYREAIARTTNDLTGLSRLGVGALLRYLWNNSRDREIEFITFNHDLVIEKSIEATVLLSTYRDIQWDIRETYGMNFEKFNNYTNKPHRFSSKGGASIRINKLHGSLNWYYRVRSGTDPRNSIRLPTGPLICLNDNEIRLGRTTMSGERPGTRSVALISLVVPPIYEKASRYQEVLRPVWTRARLVLQEADELIIFGYSFPDMDYAARSMLKQAFIKNLKLSDVHIIDTNPQIASNISELLNASCTYHYRTAQDFIAKYE